MLCSDGLWGTLPTMTSCHQLGSSSRGHAVPDLVESALRKAGDSSDNVTVIALEWETPDDSSPPASPPTASATAVLQSTIQAGGWTPTVDDLDDAAIERSIAEINEAIRRSAARRR
jgi:hypothetical protein